MYNPPKIEIEKLPYPKQEIEHLVDQILKIADTNYNHQNVTQIHETLTTLNGMLKLMCKPVLVLSEKNNE